MNQFTDIPLTDLRELSLRSFTQFLLNDYYPFFYNSINRLGEQIRQAVIEPELEILDGAQLKVYEEFDELYRKEKLVLFPFLLGLEESGDKSENCVPFKNVKLHYTAMTKLLLKITETLGNCFITQQNEGIVRGIQETANELYNRMKQIQDIKEQHFYKNLKNCGLCKKI